MQQAPALRMQVWLRPQGVKLQGAQEAAQLADLPCCPGKISVADTLCKTCWRGGMGNTSNPALALQDGGSKCSSSVKLAIEINLFQMICWDYAQSPTYCFHGNHRCIAEQ